MMTDLIQVGVVSSTHGVRGEVKVYPTTDDVKRFGNLKEVIIEIDNQEKILHIESVKYFKQLAILKFKEYQSINDVEILKGKPLYVTRTQAVPLDENEYFIADLIGMKVIDEELGINGIITDVLKTGANDVYVIELSDKREVLVPAITDCILNVNMKERMMFIHILEGLL